uniref:Uncharacterized protein n=1 Tax=Triticum urartu TaxID=4572 RepID=A0A8R7TYS4_TRIUA
MDTTIRLQHATKNTTSWVRRAPRSQEQNAKQQKTTEIHSKTRISRPVTGHDHPLPPYPLPHHGHGSRRLELTHGAVTDSGDHHALVSPPIFPPLPRLTHRQSGPVLGLVPLVLLLLVPRRLAGEGLRCRRCQRLLPPRGGSPPGLELPHCRHARLLLLLVVFAPLQRHLLARRAAADSPGGAAAAAAPEHGRHPAPPPALAPPPAPLPVGQHLPNAGHLGRPRLLAGAARALVGQDPALRRLAPGEGRPDPGREAEEGGGGRGRAARDACGVGARLERDGVAGAARRRRRLGVGAALG